MIQRKRILALLLVIAVAFVLLSSSALIVLHAGHDCTGEGCEICELLCVCVERLHQLAAAVIMSALAAAASALFHDRAANTESPGISCTLVALKVKLSN